MAFTNAEKQHRFRARVNADPQRRAELLMKQRLRQKQKKKKDGNSLVVPLYEKQDGELSVVRPEIHGLYQQVHQERYKRPYSTVPLSDESASSEAIRSQNAVQEEEEDLAAGEMDDSAERWVSHRSTTTGVRPHQSAPEVMQAAKKLVLIDQFDREYKRLQRPATAVAKTDRSLNLSNTLHRNSLSDDRKVREYIGALHRYLNAMPVEQSKAEINWSTEPATLRPVSRKKKQKATLQWAEYGRQK